MIFSLEHAVSVGDSFTDVPSQLDTIQELLPSQRSVVVDRIAFAECRQEVGQMIDGFLAGIKRFTANAELCFHCLDQQLVTRLM